MKQVQRIWISRAGRRSQKLVLVSPPWAKVGDMVTHSDGSRWSVHRVQFDLGLEVKFPARKAGSK